MPTEKEKKINEIGRKIGMALLNTGTSIVRSAFDLEPKEYSSSQIQDSLRAKLQIPADRYDVVSCTDGKYNVIDWEIWRWIKDLDLIDQLVYYSDFFDCDNYAFIFSARASTLYLLNSCGTAFGNVYDDGGNLIGRHAFNLIAIEENGKLDFMIYEAMNDNFAKLTGKRTRLAHGWTYEPTWVIFF